MVGHWVVRTTIGPFVMPLRVSVVQNQFLCRFLVVERTRAQWKLSSILPMHLSFLTKYTGHLGILSLSKQAKDCVKVPQKCQIGNPSHFYWFSGSKCQNMHIDIWIEFLWNNMKIFPFFLHQEVFSMQCYAESLMTLFQVLSIVYAKIGLKVPQKCQKCQNYIICPKI